MSSNTSSAPFEYGDNRAAGQWDVVATPRNVATSPTQGLPRLAPEALAFDLEADESLPFERHQRGRNADRSSNRMGWGSGADRADDRDDSQEIRLPKPVGSTRSWAPSGTAKVSRSGPKPSFGDMIWGDGADGVHRALLAIGLCLVGLAGVLLSVGGPVQVIAALVALIGAPVVLWPHVFGAGASTAKYTVGLVMAVSVLVIVSTITNQAGVGGITVPVALIGVITLLAGAVAVKALLDERRSEVISSMDAIDSLNTHNPATPVAPESETSPLSDIDGWQDRLRSLTDDRDISRGDNTHVAAAVDPRLAGATVSASALRRSRAASVLAPAAALNAAPLPSAAPPAGRIEALASTEADDTSGPALSWLSESYGW